MSNQLLVRAASSEEARTVHKIPLASSMSLRSFANLLSTPASSSLPASHEKKTLFVDRPASSSSSSGERRRLDGVDIWLTEMITLVLDRWRKGKR
jgi:hypothetical protein